MENIKHFFGVDLTTPSIRTLSKEDNGEFLYPYKNVVITVQEVHICPFCGKTVQGYECLCAKFSQAFKKLQDSHGDDKHASCFHGPDMNFLFGISRSISEFKVITLKKKEILSYGLDLWDYAIRHTDRLSDKSYLVTSAQQEGNTLFLLCKDLDSKSVYRFETSMPEYKDKPIYLGIQKQKTVSSGRRTLGNYHFEYYWANLAEFEDWNDVCQTLKKIWFIY